MATDVKPKLQVEIGHVLFMDVVGYSKLSVDEQHDIQQQLGEVVRGTDQFRKTEPGKLTILPTGDGMALVFFTNPEAPVECAIEISATLKKYPDLRLRMGIHSGPVSRTTDVNQRTNVAGAGINIAQRVMDCGDAGHILLSNHVAEDLEHYAHWRTWLHRLGEIGVKHGVRVAVVNFYSDEIGNPARPTKFRQLRRRRRNLVAALGVSTALIALAAFLLFQHSAGKQLEKSIAVLPFDYLSEDKQNSYFADGVQDDILADLAKVADLKVISRRSVEQYRSSTKSIREIAQALGVAYLLEGTVGKAAGRVHITARLIAGQTEAQVWAEKYDRELADVFAIQSEISETIVGRLKAVLTSAERASIEKPPTRDLEAYDLYCRARGLVQGTDPRVDGKAKEKFNSAIGLLEKAVARDPKFALAYCLLTEANVTMFVAISSEPVYRTRAEEWLKKAVQVAPDAGETHLARAEFYYYGQRDYDRALEELEAAAHLLPNNTDVLTITARLERRLGRWSEASRHFAKVIELDPRNLDARASTVLTYGMMRKYREAIQVADRTIAEFPDAADTCRLHKSEALLNLGDTKGAQAALNGVNRNTPNAINQWFNIAMYARDFAEARRANAARAQLVHPDEFSPSEVFEGFVAMAEGHTEKARAAFLAARQAYETRVRAHPQNLYFYSMPALVEAGLGNKEEALRKNQEAGERSSTTIP